MIDRYDPLGRTMGLRQVLDRAGVKAGSVAIRFRGLDAMPPQFGKSLAVDVARNDEVLLATHMNGQPLPWVHGFPLRLVVPGWFATYWVKTLSDIEVLDTEDDNYWMAKAYRIPSTPDGSTTPGAPAGATTPISTMPPRSFVTNLRDGDRLRAHSQQVIRGIAFSGKGAITRVEWSADGHAWHRCPFATAPSRFVRPRPTKPARAGGRGVDEVRAPDPRGVAVGPLSLKTKETR